MSSIYNYNNYTIKTISNVKTIQTIVPANINITLRLDSSLTSIVVEIIIVGSSVATLEYVLYAS